LDWVTGAFIVALSLHVSLYLCPIFRAGPDLHSDDNRKLHGAAKRRLRQQRLSRKRGRRTLQRRRKERIRRRHQAFKAGSLNPKFQARSMRAMRSQFNLTFPEALDFNENLAGTVAFFSQLRDLIYKVKPRSIRIDHSALQKLSPAAALVLVGDVVNGANLLASCRWQGNISSNQHVYELLGEVGYWNYFSGITWARSQPNSRLYLEHRTGNRTSGAVVNELIKHFLPELPTKADRKLLYPALIECMDNVMKHAYLLSDKNKHSYQRWWLLGFRDPLTHELSFCFYDQGLGIPKTIRVRLKDKLGPFSASDSALIVKAVVKGHYSSTKDPTRGKGLPTLKRFIDGAESGELLIVSHKSRCIFRKEADPEQLDFSLRFGGTLIIWRVELRQTP
jgi:hypothetical protein